MLSAKSLLVILQSRTALQAGGLAIAFIVSVAIARAMLQPRPMSTTLPFSSAGEPRRPAELAQSSPKLKTSGFEVVATKPTDASLQKPIDKAPKTSSAVLALLASGETLMSSNKTLEAIKCFDKAIRLDPKVGRAWQLRACVLLREGKTAQALTSIQRSIAIDPESALSHQVKGHCLFQLKKYSEARESFSRAIAIQPDTDGYQARAACNRMLKKYAAEIDDLNVVIERKPSNLLALSDRGLAYTNTKQYAQSIADYNAVLKLPELNEKASNGAELANRKAIKAHVTRQLGRCLFFQGKYDDALGVFKRVDTGDASWPPDQRAYYWRAMMFFDSGNPDRAIEDLRAGLRFKSDNLTMWRLLSGYLHGEGEDEQAEAALNEVIKRSPTRGDYLLRKLYRLSQNNINGAIEDLQTVLRLKPESYLWLELARLQQLAGQTPAARHSFLMGMKSKPMLLDSQRRLQKLLKEDGASPQGMRRKHGGAPKND